MVAADTNVLVRLIVRDDARQLAAAQPYVERGLWVSTIVLAETIWVLDRGYRLSPKEIVTAIEMLLHEHHVAFQDADVVHSALAMYSETPALRFNDCLILESARKAGHLPLVTFDKALGRRDGAQRL